MMLATKASVLGNEKRLLILQWLRDPHGEFPPQVHGDKDRDGICSVYIAERLGVTPATASAHLKLLTDAGLIRPKRMGKYTYYHRVDDAIVALGAEIGGL
ncbi:DNA-binding transcriptional ArsR family regulator [Porphyrobacter sp. MBR-155]|jgi:ArsR family transcriptional regulator|uniref:ArsR/SmtB family transcription factor n=1 Tax=Porphyrobacter sp. MBR-155 TaxID=3156464 RepID=UPI003391273E